MKTIEILSDIEQSLWLIKPEIILVGGILLLIILGFFPATRDKKILPAIFVVALALAITTNLADFTNTADLFAGALRKQAYTDALKIIVDIGAILTAFLALKESHHRDHSQFYTLLLTVVSGCHFLLMSTDMLMIFISLELISIPSYVLTGFAFQKKSAEATMKYFIYGAVASACMVYGFSLLYGLTGSTNIASGKFIDYVGSDTSYLALLAILLVIGALLFKVAAAPMHFWAPDVYEAAPTAVVAFFSTVPKAAAIGSLSVLAMSLAKAAHDWQFVLALVATITITIGNFAALAQQNIKRLMAYSSIAQSGFLVSAICIFNAQGLGVIVFYSAVYLVANFLIFHYVGTLGQRGIHTAREYAGTGSVWIIANTGILVAMISLTGLPPTAGFTAKLLVFTGIWQSFEITHKAILLILLITGLLNTVVSLFYYLKIPYYAFIKTGNTHEKQNFLTIENLFGLILVLVILMLFFAPGMLMSWINKANFVF